MSTYFQRMQKSFATFVEDEIRTARFLFLIVSIGFCAFAVFGDNDQLRGPIAHTTINWIDALYSFLVFAALAFYKPARRYYQQLGYSLIYLLNLGNVYLLFGTSFNEQYAYQFIVVYTISGWFFRHDKAYFIHTAVVNSALLLVSVVAEHKTAVTFDFYATYIIAAIAQFVLIRYRFGIEDKLSESEQKYRLLAEHSFDLICIHSADGTLEFTSPSITRLLGYGPEEMVGHKPYEIVHPEDKSIIRSVVLSEGNHPSIQHPIQYRIKHKNGNYLWIETVFVPLESPDGDTHVVLSQTRDIRRSKKYQLELEERSRELERSNADLETFAYVSSHDMQEPLRMIANYMQLLKRKYGDKLDAEANDYIEFANTGAVNLSRLIKDLLSYSRITRAELKSDAINMNALVEEVRRNIQLELDEKNATVTVSNLCETVADKNLLMLVVQNLILNGIKYNRSEQPAVTISCEQNDGNPIYCMQDNGIGIEPKHQQRIFEPFHRLHTKSEYPGTGLGLSICKKIIERHGGKLWLESEPGKGSCFYFTLH